MLLEVSNSELDKIIKIVKDGGGEVFEKKGYINFCGVRNNKTNDTFNDILYIYWKEKGEFKGVKTRDFTTKPGKKSIVNPINTSGAAIVKEGWHPDIWHHGKHQGKYEALRQDAGVTKPVTITRDNTQRGRSDGRYELRILSDTTESGYPYTNMHKSGTPQGNTVNGWSAGCQVFKYESDFNTMLKLAKSASKYGQKTFSYFLTNQTVLDSASKSENNNSNNNKNEEFDFSNSQYGDIVNDKSNSSQRSSNYSNNAYNLCSAGGVSNLGNYSNKSGNNSNKSGNNSNKSNKQSKNRESVLNTFVKGSHAPNDVKKCSELISTCNRKGVKIKSED